jgi:hypothetical protein
MERFNNKKFEKKPEEADVNKEELKNKPYIKTIIENLRKLKEEKLKENKEANIPEIEKWINGMLRLYDKKIKLYSSKNVLLNHKKITDFCLELQKRYPNHLEYLAYHIAVGSTPEEGGINFFDFPGEDSIENFLDKLLEEQEKEEKKNLNTKTEDSNKG